MPVVAYLRLALCFSFVRHLIEYTELESLALTWSGRDTRTNPIL